MAIDPKDAYEAGVESQARDDIGLFGPQNTLDEMNSVNAEVLSLDGLIKGSPGVRQEFKTSWEAFRDGWVKYFDSHNSTLNPLDYISRSLNETMDKVVEYRQKVAGWRDALRKEGVKAPGPGLGEKETDEFPWKWVLIGGGLLLGYVLVKEVGKGVGSAVDTVAKKVAE